MKKLSSSVLMFFFFIHINHNVVWSQDISSISSQIAKQIEEIKKFELTKMDDLKDYQKLLQHFIIEILKIEKTNFTTNQNIDPNITDLHSHTKDDLNFLRSYKKSLYLLERMTKEKNPFLNKIIISHQALINKYDQGEKAKQVDQTFWNSLTEFFTSPTGILLSLTATVGMVYFFWDHVINFLGYATQHSSEESQSHDSLQSSSQNPPSNDFSYTSGKDEDIPIEIGDTLDQDQADRLGYTPLLKASSEGDKGKVEKLLISIEMNESIINQKCKSGRTALTMAAFKGHSSVVQILLNDPRVNKKTLHSQDEINYTALMWASYYGHTDVVQEILNSKHFSMDLMMVAGNDDRTAQMIAFENGHQDIVKLLNEKMPPIKLPSKGWSIHIIVEQMDKKNTYNLLRTKDSNGVTALMWATNQSDQKEYLDKFGHLKILDRLLNDFYMSEDVLSAQNKIGHTSFMLAILKNNLTDVKSFLKNKHMTKDIFNLAQKRKVTPLMAASLFGYRDILNSMLKSIHMTKGAMGLRDDRGYTALLWAIEKNKVQIVKSLLDSNHMTSFTLGAKNNWKITPLLMTTAMGSHLMVKLILDSKHMTEKIFNQQDNVGNTPLILSVTENQNNMTIFYDLMKSEFISTEYINMQDIEGNTALNLASRLGLYNFVLSFANSHHLDINGLYLKNKKGMDPFKYAIKNTHANHTKILFLLQIVRDHLFKKAKD